MEAGTDASATDRDPSRAHWMELFFDLIFVALVGQLAGGLHEDPTAGTLALFVVLFASVWWSWVNLTFVVNITPELSQRALALVMLASMVAVGAIAVAAPEATGERAWLFAAGNAASRLVLLGLWWRRSHAGQRASRMRVLAYNGLTAVLWLVSIAVPVPYAFLLWALAIATEVVLLIATTSRWADGLLDRINVEHLAERFGLLVIIVLGESVLAIVTALSAHFTLASGLTAACGLLVLSALAWSFFFFGVTALQGGLEKLLRAKAVRAIRDTVGFLPFLTVTGVTVISGALSIAIAHPEGLLPTVSAVSFGGGLALFFLTNALISLRFGDAPHAVLRWAVPAVALSCVLVVAALLVPAGIVVACGVAVLAVVVGLAEAAAARRRSAARASSGG